MKNIGNCKKTAGGDRIYPIFIFYSDVYVKFLLINAQLRYSLCKIIINDNDDELDVYWLLI